MDHAAAWETSCMMHAYPECVDMEAFCAHCDSTDDYFNFFRPDGDIGPIGIAGSDPRKYASPELGAKIIRTMADLIGKRAAALLAGTQVFSDPPSGS